MGSSYREDVITELAMAIIPIDTSRRGKYSCLVIYENGQRVYETTSKRIMEAMCTSYGTTLRGRLEGIAGMSGVTHKTPIFIDSPGGMCFVPTTSPLNIRCTWLSNYHIERISEHSRNKTTVTFINGRTEVIHISCNSLKNQIIRAGEIAYVARTRKILKEELLNEGNFVNPFAKNPAMLTKKLLLDEINNQ